MTRWTTPDQVRGDNGVWANLGVTETKMMTDVKTITEQEIESNQNQMTLPLIVIIGILIGFIAYRNKDTIMQKIKR